MGEKLCRDALKYEVSFLLNESDLKFWYDGFNTSILSDFYG
jgi:hypothetical protein